MVQVKKTTKRKFRQRRKPVSSKRNPPKSSSPIGKRKLSEKEQRFTEDIQKGLKQDKAKGRREVHLENEIKSVLHQYRSEARSKKPSVRGDLFLIIGVVFLIIIVGVVYLSINWLDSQKELTPDPNESEQSTSSDRVVNWDKYLNQAEKKRLEDDLEFERLKNDDSQDSNEDSDSNGGNNSSSGIDLTSQKDELNGIDSEMNNLDTEEFAQPSTYEF